MSEGSNVKSSFKSESSVLTGWNPSCDIGSAAVCAVDDAVGVVPSIFLNIVSLLKFVFSNIIV